jgi:hypothetical protein
MSLRNQHWINMAGDTVTGRPPPKMRIMNANAVTEGQYGEIAHAYKLFSDAVNVASAPFLIQNRVLTDGSRVRLESRQGVDVVLVWPVAGGKLSIKTPPFFCIPFDETYRITPKQDTYFMKSFSTSTNGKAPVLGKLVKATNCSFIPRVPDINGVYQLSAVSHPGNQTWFANLVVDGEKHESTGYVLSWWGQPNRYSQSPLDVSLTTGKQAFKQETIDSASLTTRTILANGWTDAMDGVLYRTTTVDPYPTGVVPPYTQSSTPYVGGPSTTPVVPSVVGGYANNDAYSNALSGIATDASRKVIWLNAVRFTTDFIVHSACVGRRGETRVVRIFSQESSSLFKVREFPLTALLDNMATGGTLTNAGSTSYTLTFPAIDGVTLASPSLLLIDYMVHPFYWNADGSEAMGLFSFVRLYNYSPPGDFVGTALFKLAIAEAGFVVTLMETSSYIQTGANQYTYLPANTYGDYDDVGSSSITCNIAYKYVLAADYIGNTPKVLRGHMTEDMTATAAGRRMRTTVYTGSRGSGWFVGISLGQVGETDYNTPFSETWTTETTRTQSLAAYAQSKVSLDNVDITSLTDRCDIAKSYSRGGTGLHSEYGFSSRTTLSIDEIGRPLFRYDQERHTNARSAAPGIVSPEDVFNVTQNQTGRASLWAVSGGDLRGGNVILRESPWYFYGPRCARRASTATMDDCTWVNSSWSFILTDTALTVENVVGVGGMGTTFVGTKTDEYSGSTSNTVRYRTDVGRFVRVNTNTSALETLCNLVYPMYYTALGDLVTTSPGGSDTVTASANTYFATYPNLSYPAFTRTFTRLDGTSYQDIYPPSEIINLGFFSAPVMSNASVRTFSKVDGKQNGISTSFTGASEHTDIAFSSGAVSPDGSVQYIGIVSVALAVPNTKVASAAPFKMDQWFSGGSKITPSDPYPYKGTYKMLSCPVFTGGWLTTT